MVPFSKFNPDVVDYTGFVFDIQRSDYGLETKHKSISMAERYLSPSASSGYATGALLVAENAFDFVVTGLEKMQH